jgi:O-antigen ligase
VLAVVFVTVPGMIGTLVGLFSGIGSDSSAQSRTGSYSLAGMFIERAPIFGRGFQTFLPEYRILDNQYLLSVIETGLVGVAALLGFFVTGIVTARRARRLADTEAVKGLAQALAASCAAGMASFALFDALSFPQVANLVMLVVGVAGGLYRLLQVGGPDAVSPAAADPRGPARPAAGTA